MFGYSLQLYGKLKIYGDEYIKKLFNTDELKNSLRLIVTSSGYGQYSFTGNDITVTDSYIEEFDGEVVLRFDIQAEMLLGTDDYSCIEDIVASYSDYEITCDSRYDVDISELELVIE